MKQSSILARLIPHFSESDYSENIFLTWFNNCPPPLLCHTQFTNEIRNVQKQNNEQFFSAEQNTRLKHSHFESISCGASCCCCSLLWNFAPFGKNPTETKHTWVTTEPYVIACTEEEKKIIYNPLQTHISMPNRRLIHCVIFFLQHLECVCVFKRLLC